MIGASSLEMDIISKRRQCQRELSEMPSKELEELARDLLQKNGGRVNNFRLAFAGTYDDVFLASGACDVLRERHGEEYIERLTGLRKPKTVLERVRYWITGQMPEYKG